MLIEEEEKEEEETLLNLDFVCFCGEKSLPKKRTSIENSLQEFVSLISVL